ncbi:hypothetical protein [Salininema proteolyticum]|uniref:Uncharacterized protein n=1 Tax=Salininema proteolyticum TaxID=1607685 RepID=A0ABV8U373_9ACTN
MLEGPPRKQPSSSRGSRWITAFIVVVLFWPVAVCASLEMMLESWTFFGETPTADQVASGKMGVTVLFVAMAVCPALIALVAGIGGMKKTAAAFAVTAAVFALVTLIALVATDRGNDPAPEVNEPNPSQCIPRSGGITDCPGG